MIKANSVGFSFGYLVTKSRPRRGGGRDLLGIDLFEVSVTATPANNRTRLLSAKAFDAVEWAAACEAAVGTAPPTVAELRAEGKAAGVDELVRAAQPIRIASFEC